MAEEIKTNEVEIDTDGVNEQTIDVDAPEVKDEAFEKKQDVDLGYVDVSGGGKTAKELLQETKEAEKEETPEAAKPKFEQKEEKEEGLQDYSDKVQKRIKKLTFQIREAERREKAAVEYAKGIKNKYETAQEKYEEVDTNYLKEYDARIDAERDKAKSALKAAFDSQDPEQITEAQDKLTKLAVEKEKVSISLGEKEARKKEAESNPQQVAQPEPQISKKAQEWASENEWFGSDRVMTSAAMGIHDEIIQQGIDAETDEYYNQINKRMKEYFPQKFAGTTEEKTAATKEPVQNVASVSRRAGGRKSVKLTKSQVVIAKKLGVPLEEYAKYVKEV
jgi:hypothetical protein